jgi:hypothetical protein
MILALIPFLLIPTPGCTDAAPPTGDESSCTLEFSSKSLDSPEAEKKESIKGGSALSQSQQKMLDGEIAFPSGRSLKTDPAQLPTLEARLSPEPSTVEREAVLQHDPSLLSAALIARVKRLEAADRCQSRGARGGEGSEKGE